MRRCIRSSRAPSAPTRRRSLLPRSTLRCKTARWRPRRTHCPRSTRRSSTRSNRTSISPPTSPTRCSPSSAGRYGPSFPRATGRSSRPYTRRRPRAVHAGGAKVLPDGQASGRKRPALAARDLRQASGDPVGDAPPNSSDERRFRAARGARPRRRRPLPRRRRGSPALRLRRGGLDRARRVLGARGRGLLPGLHALRAERRGRLDRGDRALPPRRGQFSRRCNGGAAEHTYPGGLSLSLPATRGGTCALHLRRRGARRLPRLRGVADLAADGQDRLAAHGDRRAADRPGVRRDARRLRADVRPLPAARLEALAPGPQRARAPGRAPGGQGVTAALLVGFIVLMLAGVPVALAMATASLAYVMLSGAIPDFVVIHRMYGGIDSFPLLAVPFFILAGNLMNSAGITNRI